MRFSKLVFSLVFLCFFRLTTQLTIVIIAVKELFVIQILAAWAQWRLCAVFDVC